MKPRQIVAHVTTAHPVTDNRIHRKECVALAKAGLLVHLVAPSGRDHISEGVAITALPHRRGRLRRITIGQFDAWRALRRLQPRIVHVHDPELIPLAILWKHIYRRPALYDAHEDLVKQIASKTYISPLIRSAVVVVAKLLERAADRLLDGVVAATPAIRRNFKRAPVVLVQNFPWLSAFPTPTPITEATRSAAYLGAINKGRGLTEMIAAANATGCELVLAGNVTSVGEISILEGTGPNVRHLGVISVDDIPALLASSRLGLALLHPLPNYLESQSTKIYEYMAAARPFIASDFPSWREQLQGFNCGFFVDSSDNDAVAHALETLLSDLETASQMGNRGREAFELNFVFERQADVLVTLTKRLLDRAYFDPNPPAPPERYVTGGDR